jgi:hypothetical protein
VLRRVKISLRLRDFCNDGIMRVVGNLLVPTGHSRDILHQAKGITRIESTQIRWFSRLSGGGSWSGRAQLSGGQESQTKGQGAVRLPPQWATTEATRWGARRPNKELLSWQPTKRKQSLKQLWLEAQLGRRQPAKESNDWEKRKTLTLCSNLEVAEGGDVGVDEVGDEWEPECQSQVRATAFQYLRFKPGKWVLNSPLTCPAGGGGG